MYITEYSIGIRLNVSILFESLSKCKVFGLLLPYRHSDAIYPINLGIASVIYLNEIIARKICLHPSWNLKKLSATKYVGSQMKFNSILRICDIQFDYVHIKQAK